MKPTEDRTTLLAELNHSASSMRHTKLSNLFNSDGQRADKYAGQIGPLWADYAKQHIDANIIGQLRDLAEVSNVASGLNDIATAKPVNTTEQRAACHNLLRSPVGNRDEAKAVRAMRSAMREKSDAFRKGCWPNTTVTPTHIIHIGIGGSDLGPRLLFDALSGTLTPCVDIRFVANVDPADLQRALAGCEPATTMVIVSSKSFGTEETLQNADTARQWLANGLPANEVAGQCIAITANPEAAQKAGYLADNIIGFPCWVGGRFSVWSAIGFPIALAFGMDVFESFLTGGAAVDKHVIESEPHLNHAITLGLIDVWNSSFLRRPGLAVLPYDHNFRLLPSYLQQLMMESNGKSVTRQGLATDLATNPIVWGSEGTNGQHSFHQLLHQGNADSSCDFLLPLRGDPESAARHEALVAHCLSQSLVLMQGRDLPRIQSDLIAAGLDASAAEQLAPHKVMPGNRSSTTLCYPRSGAEALGALIALYEYRALVAALIWNINPFDQWGVELGKVVSTSLAGDMRARRLPDLDGSTRQLLSKYYSTN